MATRLANIHSIYWFVNTKLWLKLDTTEEESRRNIRMAGRIWDVGRQKEGWERNGNKHVSSVKYPND